MKDVQHLITMLNPVFIHYWKMFISDITLQRLLDFFSTTNSPSNKRMWLILLDEKLKRHEQEIYIPEPKEG